MITREADYTIRALLYLGRPENRERTVPTRELSEEMDIPYRFLRKLVTLMTDNGLVISRRGKGGGIKISKDPSAFSLLDVLQLIDERSITLNTCIREETSCNRSGYCSVHDELKTLQHELDEHLSQITFDKLIKKDQN
jgi:Rrf2 family protein